MQPKQLAALYIRLSKDDESVGESSSIKTQRNMLRSYANENGFIVYDEYIDDGFSGTNFDRPNFQRMLADIENKRVTLVITKDLSRLGRDYIATGQFTEIYFPSKGIRYIAINDGYDSAAPFDDIVPFKNVINELYARDTSKKIRSAFLTKMKDGSFIGNFAPYGYRKDPDNKNHLLIDEAVAPVVREIFDMATKGYKPSEIAKHMNSLNIYTPAMYRCENNKHLNLDNYSKRREWTSATISKMLRNVVYMGHTAQKKTTKVSFKSKVSIQNPREDWIVVENTHEPLVDKECFETVRRRAQSRICERNKGFVNIFSGIAKCGDCGRNMSAVGTRKKDALANLTCGGYKLYGALECSNHFIDFSTFYDIVLNAIREQVRMTEDEKQLIAFELQKEMENSNKSNDTKEKIAALIKQNKQLDAIIEKLYADNFEGTISNDRFRKLLDNYEKESQAITAKINILSEALSANNANAELDYNQYLELVREYTSVKTLTTDLLFKLIERIEVGQGQFIQTAEKQQEITIYFRF